MPMYNPKMYAKFNALQRQDALHCLQKFGSKMKWKKNASVIDLGCGDGSVTTSILKEHLPADFKEIVGIDISKEMVEHAAKTYGNQRIKFGLMDITSDVPKELQGAFDHAFSSYMLQFVPDQEKAFSNFYKLLKKEGSCLLLFMASSSLYETFVVLSKTQKWESYSKAVEKIIPRYHMMKDPAAEVIRLMKESRFKDIHVEADKTSFEYETYDSMLKMVESANLLRMPLDVLGDFMKDYDEALTDIGIRLVEIVQPVI